MPAGLLSPDAGRQLALLEGPVAEAKAVAFTVEPAGGSPQPTTVPLGSVGLPAWGACAGRDEARPCSAVELVHGCSGGPRRAG
ncbi:hypothetical protein ABT010_07290 [Streptomyces sp. NPDC002668]|uniref:anti-sigma factor domain-containing protein n=1 Tax=Streptomyces sp. NPDC002668 TaxID=3154422 RepID=UPI00331AF978